MFTRSRGEAAHDADRPQTPTPPRLTRARVSHLLSLYRPHRLALVADLACATLASLSTLALPLAAGQVTRRLEAGTADATLI
jgi:hypothetical protein